MNGIHGPVGDGLQGGNDGFQHLQGDLSVGLGLLVGEELHIVVGQGVEEVHLLRDVCQFLTPGPKQSCDDVAYFINQLLDEGKLLKDSNDNIRIPDK